MYGPPYSWGLVSRLREHIIPVCVLYTVNTVSYEGDKITHPPRTIFTAGSLDNGEGVLNTTSDGCVYIYMQPSERNISKATIFVLCACPCFGAKPSLKFVPRGGCCLDCTIIRYISCRGRLYVAWQAVVVMRFFSPPLL